MQFSKKYQILKLTDSLTDESSVRSTPETQAFVVKCVMPATIWVSDDLNIPYYLE